MFLLTEEVTFAPSDSATRTVSSSLPPSITTISSAHCTDSSARPIRALTVAMDKLAGGDFSVVLPGLGRKDEVGGVAAAVEKFKVVSEQKAREEAEAKIRQDQIAAAQRKAEMHKLADSFEAAIGEIVDTVSSASTELEASASTLTSTAARGQELTTMVAAASE